MFKKANKLKGFTLIELLVVIAIIAILAVVIILNLTQARKKARDATRKDDLRNFTLALESYYDDEEHYVSVPTFKKTGETNVFDKIGPLGDYLKSDVRDPRDGTAGFYYKYKGGANSFTVCAETMEIDSNVNNSKTNYCISNE